MIKVIPFVFILFAGSALGSVKSYEVEITEVLKGDSFVYSDRAGNTGYLYLTGIDCPELGQEGGKKAKRFAESKVLGKRVWFDEAQRIGDGVYGFVKPSFGSQDLGSDLLVNGNAWVDETESDLLPATKKASYRLFFDSARLKKVGIWRSGKFMNFGAVNPRKFRELQQYKINQPRFNGTNDPRSSGFGRKRN